MTEKKLRLGDKIPLGPYARLTYSWDMVLCLADFIHCIGLNKKDLKSPRNKQLMEFKQIFYNDKEFNPGGVLSDYIYLEANSFFKYAKKLKSSGDKNIPDLPDYLKDLEDFRNVMVGHRDVKENYSFFEDWMGLQEKISKLIPKEKLVRDVDFYYQEVMRRSHNQ